DAIAAMGTTRPTVLPADLGRADATQAIAEALDRRGLEPDVVVNNAGFGLLGAADTLDRAEQLAMIAPRRTRAHRSFARLCRQPQTPQGRHSQPGVDRGVHAGPRHGGLLRQQGLCALVQRGALPGAEAEGRAGHRALPRPGADRVSS